jgi:uncharacterized protein involved in exopolysaccharide biosynthesis
MEYQQNQEQQLSLLNFLNILFKRKGIIISFFIAVVAVVTAGSLILPPVFEAGAKLLLEREYDSDKSLLFRMNLQQRFQQEEWINSEIEILKSYPVAQRVVKSMDLHLLEVEEDSLDEEKLMELAINAFQKNLNVENIKNSNVLQVSYEAKDPQLVADIVNTVVKTYIDYRGSISDQSDSYQFFEEQMRVADEKLRELEQRQSEYKKQKGVLTPESQREILTKRLSDYEQSLTGARTRRIGKEAKLAVIKEQMLNGRQLDIPVTESSDSPSRENYIAKLKGDLLDMEIEREKLLQKYTPRYEEVVNLNKQIEATKEKIMQEINQIVDMEEASIRALRAEEQVLENAIAGIKRDIRDMATREYEYSQISRGIDDSKEVYSMLLKQREEARLSMAKLEKEVKIKVISPAVPPTYPSKPRKKLNVALAMFLGMFGGLGLAFFFEYFDHSINSPAELEKNVGINPLGSVREIDHFTIDGSQSKKKT